MRGRVDRFGGQGASLERILVLRQHQRTLSMRLKMVSARSQKFDVSSRPRVVSDFNSVPAGRQYSSSTSALQACRKAKAPPTHPPPNPPTNQSTRPPIPRYVTRTGSGLLDDPSGTTIDMHRPHPYTTAVNVPTAAATLPAPTVQHTRNKQPRRLRRQ